MSNNFTMDQLTKVESIDPNSINRLYKVNLMLNFMEIRSNNPRMTQKQICNQLGFSDSTIKRYRDDIQMDSPYNRYNNKKNKTKQKPDTTISQSQQSTNETNRNKIIEKRIKNRLKNQIKGGDISDNKQPANTIHEMSNDYRKMSGKQLIEEAFKTTIND